MKGRLADVRDGLNFGYPLCCVLRFALRRNEFPARTRGVRHGLNNPHVPCNLLHWKDK